MGDRMVEVDYKYFFGSVEGLFDVMVTRESVEEMRMAMIDYINFMCTKQIEVIEFIEMLKRKGIE